MKSFLTLSLLLLSATVSASPPDSEVRGTISAIYQLGAHFEKLLKTHSGNEDAIKTDLKKYISNITTGNLHQRWMEFIKQTPVSSSFYHTVFESMTPQGKLDVQSISSSGRRSEAKVKMKVKEIYAPSIDMITLDELFAKYKISNMTFPQIIAKLPTSSLAELVEYKIISERVDTHKLRLKDGKWKISKIEQEIVSSTIEVILPKKKDALQSN